MLTLPLTEFHVDVRNFVMRNWVCVVGLLVKWIRELHEGCRLDFGNGPVHGECCLPFFRLIQRLIVSLVVYIPALVIFLKCELCYQSSAIR